MEMAEADLQEAVSIRKMEAGAGVEFLLSKARLTPEPRSWCSYPKPKSP